MPVPVPESVSVESAWPRGARTLLVVLLLAAVYAGYSRCLDGELQFDDLRLLNENRAVKDLAHYLGAQVWAELRIAGRALTYLSFAINYHFTVLEVRPYHLVNLAAHLACILAILALTLAILRRLGWPSPFPTALVVAALFGLHPLQSQAVAYVFQRAEVLGSLFYVLALVLALAAEERGLTRRGAAAYLGALLCFFLGWASKPMVATLPAALILLAAAFPSPRLAARPPRARAAFLSVFSLPFWAITAVFSRLLFGGLSGSGEAGFSIPTMSVRQYLLTQPRVVLTYLRLLAWPAGQNVDWEFPPSHALAEPATALASLALAALLCGAAFLLYRSTRPGPAPRRSLERATAAGIFFFFLLLLPTSSIVPLRDVIEEHRVYLACWGLFLPATLWASLAVGRLAPGRQGLAGAVLAVAVASALLFALQRRNAVWETAVSLWSDVVAKSPGKARGHMNLGYALIETDPERALAETRLAQRLAGDASVNTDELDQNLAGILLRLGRTADAIVVLQRIAAQRESAEVDTNLAIALLSTGQTQEARALTARAIARWPRYGPAWHTLGQLDSGAHDDRRALEDFQRAVALDPDSLASLSSLAVTQQRLGDRTGACASWSRYGQAGVAGAAETAAAARAALDCPGH